MCALAVLTIGTAPAHAQAGRETFKATATVKTASDATTTAPVTITVDRKMSESEADALKAAFTAGGAAALRKALVGIPPTGSLQLGGGKPTPTRLTIERPTDKGRLLTIVTDQPVLFLGAGVPGAKPKEGTLRRRRPRIDATGAGSGTIAPAAKVTLKQGAFTVEDYASELVKLTRRQASEVARDAP